MIRCMAMHKRFNTNTDYKRVYRRDMLVFLIVAAIH